MRRLVTTGSSHLRKCHALFSRSPISPCANRRHCSVDKSGSLKFDDNVVRNQDEHQIWHNGGGTFHKSACIAPTALIELGAILHPNSFVGSNAHIGSGAIIGPAVTVGQLTKIGYNVALSNCTIGDSCIIHSGVCIGQDGFGLFVDEHGDMVKKPQLLKAMIGSHVEIGANSCIHRSRTLLLELLVA
ncbi:hypothetical protein RJ640_005519 [Escallonia rubra]|uniref:Mannose-1-phosphate guanyltransferase C-terminal domain-containing protein n=1 Tax=Escallonia rubra TaxID=112253 RepID=A0AA88QW31_9ASTE|nr:hypothetical protein RJ640_005519 [Escallonia rubra]